jgi:phage baseplate assembly protein gpV
MISYDESISRVSWQAVVQALLQMAASDVFSQLLDRNASLDAPHVGLAQHERVEGDIPGRGQGWRLGSSRHRVLSSMEAGRHAPGLICRNPETSKPLTPAPWLVGQPGLNSS